MTTTYRPSLRPVRSSRTTSLPSARRGAVLAPVVALALLTAACSGTAEPRATPTATPSSTGTAAAPEAAVDTTPMAPEPTPEPDAADESPEASFRAWLAASRAPAVETACGYMTPTLVDRMVAEMTAQGWPGITDCSSMITTTAELYAAVGDVAEVEIAVREERPDATVLSVAYAGGDCGSAVMVPEGARWIITEQSEEQC
ncbi:MULTISPECIES: hypothetical protein [Oerskovia]|uniref:Lipoprotein n=1 Tax=Oerskovia merdavium TaxID=2762227 RepID=A0ABR8TZD0_9CELL|nr:hypothetical protein [Oerskovia merdavium]MBD7981151.1 hypothetical protein [Oerskovia merdavium]